MDLAHRPRRGDAPRRPGRRRRDPRRARPRPVAGAAVRAREPIRQAASSLGAAQYCVDEAAAWARERSVGGRPLWRNQGIQLPLAEPWTDRELVRGLVRRTAAELDRNHHLEVSHLVAMANYRANRLACDAADRAMQACGGIGYTRRMPFEHIYRHHRRYRITEGTEEVQLRKVAYELFKP